MSNLEDEKFHELVREQKEENEHQRRIQSGELNREARMKLVNEISKRLQLVRIVSQRNIDYAVQYGDRAMVKAEAFSLDEAEKDLEQTVEWIGYAVSGLQTDLERIKGPLLDTLQQVRESER